MEEESFDQEDVAEVLNKNFISIKVDKEERPDLDAVYMAVCQAFTGQGGWPTTVILTPDQKPFFAGTYFPREGQPGRTGLLEILEAASDAWNSEPDRITEAAEQVVHRLSEQSRQVKTDPDWLDSGQAIMESAEKYYSNAFDERWGGFGTAPKFPAAHNLLFLLKLHEKKYGKTAPTKEKTGRSSKELAMVEKTLQQMYAGGMYDHIGFGFCRYSTDQQWLVPHFEKMLYDNALLCMAYTECWCITQKPFYRRIAEEIIQYVLREMRGTDGGFYSSQDADSGGEEGGYYVFRPEEIREVLGEEEAAPFCQLYDISDSGNFEGKSIPNLIKTMRHSPELIAGLAEQSQWSIDSEAKASRARRQQDEVKEKLRKFRKKRAQLHTDDKVLTSWNSLMIMALARACQAFGKQEYLMAAQGAEQFLREKLTGDDLQLKVRYRDGESAGDGFLDDYAFYELALLELFNASHRVCYLQRAIEIQERMEREFWDEEGAGFFFTGKDQEKLIFRPKETYDGAMPSGNSAAALAMVTLNEKMGMLSQRGARAMEQLGFVAAAGKQQPATVSYGLIALLSRMEQTSV